MRRIIPHFIYKFAHYAVHSSFQRTEHSLEKFKTKERGQYQKDPGLAAMTQDLDDGVGIILKKIKELGIDDNTYIIYMSDNGSIPNVPGAKKYINSYNYPLSRGKWDAMEGGIRVPLIVSGPGINPKTECNESVSGSDILPTIVSLAGGDKVELNNIDGGSIKNNLFNNANSKVIREVEGIIFHVPYRNGIALKRPHSAIIKRGL
jgi:Arylsulfatase A and related enzymes